MQKISEWFKNEAVLIISAVAAGISCMFVPVTDYIKYIDTDTIGMLFSLMAIVAGFKENGVLDKMSGALMKKAGSARIMVLVLILITFFSSMLITNDVALITFVPLTIMVFGKMPSQLIYVTVLQTAAANMGSMLTPVGNPQNLYLYNAYNMETAAFFKDTVPVCAVSLILILIMTAFVKNDKLENTPEKTAEIEAPSYVVVYAMLFVLALLSVFGFVDTLAVFASVCVVVVIMEPKIFSKVDYSLLLTFVFFFIFVGNVKNITEIQKLMNELVSGHEFEVSLVLSQVISNVPAAVMMSAFTENGREVLLGTDIGGLGTIIASLASLISFRIYNSSENNQKGRFMAVFTAVNVIMLVVVGAFAKIVLIG